MMASPYSTLRANEDLPHVRGTRDDYIMTQNERQGELLLQKAVQVFTQA